MPDCIVSISKSYIRPIVRGNEVKAVEFGAKVNMIQFDGINFIEHLSFNAFNEGTRLVKSIRYALQKIKARTEKNEILWIFFEVHTANAVRIAKRLSVSRIELLAS